MIDLAYLRKLAASIAFEPNVLVRFDKLKLLTRDLTTLMVFLDALLIDAYDCGVEMPEYQVTRLEVCKMLSDIDLGYLVYEQDNGMYE